MGDAEHGAEYLPQKQENPHAQRDVGRSLREGILLPAVNKRNQIQHLDDAESIDVEIYTLKELCDMIYAGKIQDSKTVSAVLAYSNMIK